jgi:ATP-dependent Clp protease ATP-binding subunit ClpC
MLRLELKKQRREESRSKNEPIIDEDDICRAVSSITKIPVKRLAHKEREELKGLESSLLSRVIGQRDAIKSISNAIKRGRQGLKSPNRPIGSFLFLGPTGVGKTHIAKEIASIVFGSYDSIIRLDMSEYAEKHSISRLIGSPPGYVGYDDGGILTEAVRRHPYSIVLFDEIEKAHKDLYNILLQILDDGILTDSRGRRTDFKNTIIILTSNIGAKSITEPKRLGFFDASVFNEYEAMKKDVSSILKMEFSPELLNRLDEIIIFNKLSEEDIEKICSLMLNDVKNRASNIGISIDFEKSAIEFLSKIGYDSVYGARPLRRAIVSYVENLISEKMLEEEIKVGDSIVIYSDGERVLIKEKKDA